MPSSPAVHISGSLGLPPPEKMTARTVSKCPRRPYLSLKFPVASVLFDREFRESSFPECRFEDDDFLRWDPGGLFGDLGMSPAEGNTSVSGRPDWGRPDSVNGASPKSQASGSVFFLVPRQPEKMVFRNSLSPSRVPAEFVPRGGR